MGYRFPTLFPCIVFMEEPVTGARVTLPAEANLASVDMRKS